MYFLNLQSVDIHEKKTPYGALPFFLGTNWTAKRHMAFFHTLWAIVIRFFLGGESSKEWNHEEN